MTKICKFCSSENKDTEEVCSKCGAALPIYTQYEAELIDDMKKDEKHFFHINLRRITKIISAVAAIILLIYFFKPSANPELLPDLKNNRSAVRDLMFFTENVQNNINSFDFNIMTTPAALSLYITSHITPDAADNNKFSPDLLPRVIINAPADDLKKMSLVKHSKIYLLPVRTELNFKQNQNGSWQVESWKFCNLPEITIFKDDICKIVMKDFKSNKKLQQIFSLLSTAKRTKSHLIISIKHSNKTQTAAGKNNLFISRINPACKGSTNKNNYSGGIYTENKLTEQIS